jgi:hypothetical protein
MNTGKFVVLGTIALLLFSLSISPQFARNTRKTVPAQTVPRIQACAPVR